MSTPRRSTARPTPGPAEIAPGVFVGGWADAVGFEGARFCVLDEAPEGMPSANHIRIYDERSGRGLRSNLDRLARKVGAARATGAPVLVFCGHGVRRAPLAGAWYLHRSEKLSLAEAFARVRAARPKAEPPEAWIGNVASLDEV